MKSQERIAAARYAAAYNQVSATSAQARQNAEQLQTAAQILAGVSVQLQSPRLSAAQKKEILAQALEPLPQAAAFIRVLIDANRLNLLPEICTQVNALLDKRLGVLRAEVTSAQELNAAQQQATQQALSSRYGKTVQARFKTNPALLGGLKITCNEELLDGSLQTRLEKLRQELTK